MAGPPPHPKLLSGTIPIKNSRQVILIVLPVVFTALATVCVGLRFYARHLKKARAMADDYFCVLALILAYGQLAALLVMVLGGGMGLTYRSLSMPTLWILFKGILADYVLWIASVTALQVSILFLYTRIFGIARWIRLSCYVVMGIVTAWAIGGINTRIFACANHVDKATFTAPNPTLKGTCVDEVAICESIGLLHVVFDFLILLLPMPLVWRLKTSMGTKILLSLLLCLSIFASVTSILRMQCMLQLLKGGNPKDPTVTRWMETLFQSLEVPVGIICVCVPTFPVLGNEFMKSRFGSYVKSMLRSVGLSTKGTSSSDSKDISGGNNKNLQRMREGSSGMGSKLSQDSQIPLSAMDNSRPQYTVQAFGADRH